MIGDIFVTSPLETQDKIPRAGYDEWYLFEALPASIDIPGRYVNWIGFHLEEPHVLATEPDPGSNQMDFDWLTPIQTLFWSDMDRINPTTYIGNGSSFVVVSQNSAFIAAFSSLVYNES